MKGKFSKTEMRGLPGGPNEQFTYVTGVFMQDMYHVPEAQKGLEKYQTKGEFNYNFLAPYKREWVPNKDRRGGKYVNKGIDYDNWNIEEPSQIQRSSTSVQQPFILSPKEWEAYNKDKAIQEKPGMFDNFFNYIKKGANRVYSDPGIIARRTNLLFDNLITSEDEVPVNIGLRRKLSGDKSIWDETDLTFEDLSDQEFGIVMNLTNDEKMDSTYKDFQASQIIGGDYIDQNSRISRTASEFKNMDWEALKKKSKGDDYFDHKENEGYIVNPEQKGYYKIGVRNKNTNFNPQKDYFYGVQDGKVIAGPIDKFRDETIITPMRFGHRYYTKDNPPDLEKMKASSGTSPHRGDIKQLLYSPTTGAIGMTSKSQGIMDFYNKYGDVIPIYLDDGSYGYVSTSRGASKLDYSDYQDYMASSLNKDRPKKGVDKHGSGQVGNNFGYNIYIKQKGGEGYRIDALNYNDPYKFIPSGNITMTEQDGGPLKKGPLLGIDNMGNQQMMFPGYEYVFPGNMVMEIPVAQKGKGNFSVRPFARVFPINEPEFRALTGDIGIDTNIKNKPTYFRTSVRPTFGYSPLDPFQTYNLDLKGEGRVGYRIGDFNTELGVQKNLMRSDDPQLQASLGFNNRKFGINASTNIPTKNNPNFFPRVDLRYSPNEKLTFTGDAEYDSITKSPRFNVGLNYRFMQEGKELQKGQKGKIIKSIFDQYPGLYNVASPKDYKPIKAKGKHLEHLETTGTDVEYFAPGDTWYPFQYTTDIKLLVPGSKNKHRMLYNPNLQNIEEALKLDIISHSYNTPETEELKADLDSKLRERYGDSMVDANGGVDGYIRGYLSNSEEYAPYKKELEFLPKNYFKPFMEGLMKKQRGGSLPRYQSKGEVLTYQDNPEYFDNKAVLGDNIRYSDLVKKRVYAGTHGYNPTTGEMVKLDSPQRGATALDLAYSKKEEDRSKDEQSMVQKQGRRNRAFQDLQALYRNPVFLAPGMITAAATLGPQVMANPLFNNPYTTGALTGIGTYDAITNSIPSAYKAAKEKRYLDAAGNTAMASLDLLPIPFFGTNLIDEVKQFGKALTKGPSITPGQQLSKNLDNASLSTLNNSKPVVTPSSIPSQPATVWQMEELPGLHLKSTMSQGPIFKIVDKSGRINVEQALAIINKESGGKEKVNLIKQALGDNIPKKMDFNDFRKATQEQLIPLERQFSTKNSNYGINRLGYLSPKRSSYDVAIQNTKDAIARGENVVENQSHLKKLLNEYSQLPLENQTLILSNKSKFGRGSAEHDNPEETLGHIHFLRDAETPDVLTVTQIQSDAFQGTHRVMPNNSKIKKWEKILTPEGRKELVEIGGEEAADLVQEGAREFLEKEVKKAKEALGPNPTQKQLLEKSHQERYLQELVDYASKRGDINKIRVPTKETAAKVQNYTKTNIFTNPDLVNPLPKNATEAQKKAFNKYLDDIRNNRSVDYVKEDYGDTEKTILKKYSKQPKTIKKLFGKEPKIVKDNKGNTWYEFDIPESFKKGKGQIKVYNKGGEFQKLVNKYTTKGWQSLTDQEKQTYKEMYQQYK